ncbi:hypothetical protein C8R32_10868 [Nitrosospira sp. Nsp5]|uniref:Uncharacterized protein n=1 Tax=Nitrosospira multiformis TaxID=1231 RepID=A0ABY0T6J5_9PROT|nr:MULTISPECIES: hypothetical protein [Nitrosospira]PTR07112.1 hypothetical protein C8R32_10868 [Nitrosospira sp. Nsp5]SDQ33793.1 hypothetical protein SAMN05216402_0446 [Nitrosospira multiformis]
MSAYLARLKQFEREKNYLYTPEIEPSKPSKAPFEPFEGNISGDISENIFVAEEDETVARVATGSVANPWRDEAEELKEEGRHQHVLEMLSNNPMLKYAVLMDHATTDPVLVTVGIRGLAVFDMQIPKANYDGIALLQVIEQYSTKANPLPEEKECSQAHPSEQQRKAA